MTALWGRRAIQDAYSDERKTLEDALGQMPLFEGLAPSELSELVPSVRCKVFQDEEIVCHCPDALHDAFVTFDGVVAVTKRKELVTHVLQLEKPGSVFNIAPLVGIEAEQAGVRALGKVLLLAFDNAMLSEKLSKDPSLGYLVLRNICRLASQQYERQLERYLD